MSEAARQAHMKKHGSFLLCPERDVLCTFMEGAWETGCQRKPCIKDDPEDQKLQERIEKNRQQATGEKKEDPPETIRDQRNMIKSKVQQQWDEVHRLEEASRQAYYDNKPKLGDNLFNKARYLRGELRRAERERKGR